MEIQAALLANQAGIGQDGLLYVQGGGWEFYDVPRLPWTAAGCFAGLIEFGAHEIGSTPALRLTIDQDGQDSGLLASMIVDASRHRAPFAIPFTLAVNSADTLVVKLSDEQGEALASIDCPLRLPPAPSPED